MEINKDNYEIFFLDYHEGNLSAEMQAEVVLFLQQHPEFKAEFESFEMINLPVAENVLFPDKNSLKKEMVTKENYAHFLIGSLEGDLKKEEQLALDKFLFTNPEFKKDEQLFSMTKLTVDTSIVFDNKSVLKQAVPIAERNRVAYYFAVAAAACILLLMGVYFINKEGDKQMQADNQHKKEIKKAEKTTQPKREEESTKNVKLNVIEKENNVPAKENNKEVEQEEETSNEPMYAATPVKKNKKDNANSTFASNTINNKRVFEEIDFMEQKTIAFVVSGEIPQQQIAFINIQLLKQQTIESSSVALNDLINQLSDPDAHHNLAKPMTIADTENINDVTEKKSVLDVLAWGFSKVSNEDVKLQKQYDSEGQLVAYQFESGKIKFGKK